MTDKVGLASPWVTYARKIYELFGADPDIQVIFNEEENDIKLYVEDTAKAEALTELLPEMKEFGEVILTITIVPANEKQSKVKLFRKAFEGNPIVSYIETVEDLFSNPLSYVVFENEVVQFFNDNLGDIHGLTSTLYENIARDIFDDTEGILFCTDLPKYSDTLIEQWP